MKDVSNATAYALLVPALMKAGREVGYALAVHGSMARDLDLVDLLRRHRHVGCPSGGVRAAS